MPLVSAAVWQQYTGQTVTGPDLTAVTAWSAAVDAALQHYLRPYYPEPQTVTLYLDAPPARDLLVPAVPIRSVTALYLNPRAEGVDGRFTSTTLQTAGVDYELVRDDPVTGWSRSGRIRRLGPRLWATAWLRERPYQLAPSLQPARGAVKLIAEVGPAQTPADIIGAAVQAVTMLFRRRPMGYPMTSESWNGYSYNTALPAVQAALQAPDVLAVLERYRPVPLA